MLDILNAIGDTLPPTKTYARRSFYFIPAMGEYRQKTGLLGQLLIKLQHSKTGTRRAVECDGYTLERDTPEPGDNGGQAFWVHNITDPEAEEAYRCVVGGLTPKCTCKAGKCKVNDDTGELVCKHFSALKHLIEMGML